MATKYSEQVQKTFTENNPFARKNFFINGNMDIWQRGTSFTSVDNSYSADKFAFSVANSVARGTLTRSSDVPSVAQVGQKLNYSIKIDVAVTDTSVASTDVVHLVQKIEGFYTAPLIGNVVTFSFWVKSNKTGTYCVSTRYGSDEYSYISEFTINSANTWEKKIITLQMPDASVGTWDFTNGVGLKNSICLMAGSSFQTTSDSWNAGNKFGTSNQVNLFDSSSNNFYTAGWQLEIGSVATPLEFRPFAQELILCQRYYETGTTGYFPCVMTATTAGYVTVPMKVQKRANASTGVITLTSSQLYLGSWANTTNTNLSGNTNYLIFTYYDTNRTYVIGGAYLSNGNWTVDVEI